jgi:two-component system, chemotaxis family, CheB/CheR fusion protein
MPPETNMAFVIIQHLSPNYKSIMADLLLKYTKMKILVVEDDIPIQPNCIYLNPPDKNVFIINRRLYLTETQAPHGINLPIDNFFRTLSEELGEKGICIILSGTATDGTLGMKAIKGAGGMAMVQDPVSAKYDGMPNSAIATGLADFILPVEKMPSELIKYVQHPYIHSTSRADTTAQNFKNNAAKTLALIRTASGHDFSGYKKTTLHRRIARRMAVHQIDRIEDYTAYLQKTPAEVDLLFKDLLIGVTSFFRDAKAFDALKNKVLPELIKNKTPDKPLRIWVAGCATGEEAYSMAILTAEVMKKQKKHFDIQIFASDINAEALDVARAAVYPVSIAADVSQERLNRYFVKEDNSYKVKKQIRERIVFAAQNLIKDPPFSRLDLVSCRNLFIYMEPELQKKILPIFHYTLNPGGILFLGTSETVGEFDHLFEPVDAKHKIFKHKDDVVNRVVDYPRIALYDALQKSESTEEKQAPAAANIHSLAERIVIENYAPACVLINERYEILHFIGQTDKYLATPTGKASFNILNMARQGLRYKLSTALHNAVKQKKTITSQGLKIKYESTLRTVDLVVRPVTESGASQGFMLVMFNDKTMPEAVPKKSAPGGEVVDPYVLNLEQELQTTKEYLQTLNEEMETSNEELKSTNEELQSTNEELETSKEELQSTNEELVTVNEELQKKVEELSHANNDMTNLLAATEIGCLFLDTNLRIKRFTPAATRIFHLVQTDIGRPISDIKSKFVDENIVQHSQEVLDTLVRQEIEVQDKAGNWYSMRIMPYRTIENVIDGIVVTFNNINHIKEAKELRRLATVVRDSNDAIVVQDFSGNILAWNHGAGQLYGLKEAEALRMNIRDLIPEDKIKQTRTLFARLKKGKIVKPFETRRKCKNGKVLDVWLTMTALKDAEGRPVEIASTERDISELKQLRSSAVKG